MKASGLSFLLAALLASAPGAAPPVAPTGSGPVDVPGGKPPAPGAAPGAAAAPANQPDSVRLTSSAVLKAMGSELKRSMDSLRLRGGPKPYFLSYLIWDIQSYRMQASLGAVEESGFEPEHLLEVDLRVGNYAQDNTNFQGGIIFGPRLRLPLPQENDTNLIRQAIWATTDARYKVAVEQLAQKKAFLANHSGKDSLPDFTRPKAHRQARLDMPSPPDTAKAAALGRELSRYLGGFPWLSESRVGYQYYYTTWYYVDSDGSRFIQTAKEHTLLVSLLTQARDGAPLWDYFRLSTHDPLEVGVGEGPASLGKLKLALKPLLERLDGLRKAPPLANYRGPVLFTGTAAGELLNKALLSPQSRLREPLGANSEPNFLISLKDRKLFPADITVTDTPAMKDYQGRPLFGHYTFDHQGQPARDLVLVKQGRIADYFLGKVPVFRAGPQGGNGHWRYGGGFPGIARLESSRAVTEADLKGRLAALSAEEGTGYGIVVSKVLDEDAFKLLHHPLAIQLVLGEGGGEADGKGSFSLPPPCELDRIDARTGALTPVRGLSFPPVDSKSLRDIVAVGNTLHLYEPQASFSVLCPSLLFSLLDMKGSRSSQPRLPYLP